MAIERVEACKSASGYEVRVSGNGREERIGGWRLAVVMDGELATVNADPSPLFEAVGALMRLFEAAGALIERRIRPPYGVEAAGLYIDMANGIVAEYVIKGEEGEIPVRIIYSPEGPP